MDIVDSGSDASPELWNRLSLPQLRWDPAKHASALAGARRWARRRAKDYRAA